MHRHCHHQQRRHHHNRQCCLGRRSCRRHCSRRRRRGQCRKASAACRRERHLRRCRASSAALSRSAVALAAEFAATRRGGGGEIHGLKCRWLSRSIMSRPMPEIAVEVSPPVTPSVPMKRRGSRTTLSTLRLSICRSFVCSVRSHWQGENAGDAKERLVRLAV